MQVEILFQITYTKISEAPEYCSNVSRPVFIFSIRKHSFRVYGIFVSYLTFLWHPYFTFHEISMSIMQCPITHSAIRYK